MATKTYPGRVISYPITDIEYSEKAQDGDSAKQKSRKIRGYANKNIIDRGNQRIEPEAFAAAMSAFMQNPVLFYNHDWYTPIGKVIDWSVDGDGLYVEAELGHGYPEADKVWMQIEQGLLKSFSVGLRPDEIEEEEDGTEVIKALQLFEVSVVTIPMNKDSLFEVSEKGELNSITFVDDSGQPCTYKQLIDKSIAVTAEMVASESVEPEAAEEAAEEPVSKDLDEATTTSSEDESITDKAEEPEVNSTEEIEEKGESIQPTLEWVEGTCAFCETADQVISYAVDVYGRQFYACFDCVCKSNSAWHEKLALKDSLLDEFAIRAKKLQAANETLTVTVKKYKNLIAKQISTVINDAIKVVVD